MWTYKNMLLILCVMKVVLFNEFLHCQGFLHHYDFYVKEASYERLCERKNILTVNGQFPGPTLYAHKGDTIYVNVHNNGKDNITLRWHGVKLERYPWSDGAAFITQCMIQPGKNFRQKIIFSTEEGTVWWDAHSDWPRATVHGAIIAYPKYESADPPSSIDPTVGDPPVLATLDRWRKPPRPPVQAGKGGHTNSASPPDDGQGSQIHIENLMQ